MNSHINGDGNTCSKTLLNLVCRESGITHTHTHIHHHTCFHAHFCLLSYLLLLLLLFPWPGCVVENLHVIVPSDESTKCQALLPASSIFIAVSHLRPCLQFFLMPSLISFTMWSSSGDENRTSSILTKSTIL